MHIFYNIPGTLFAIDKGNGFSLAIFGSNSIESTPFGFTKYVLRITAKNPPRPKPAYTIPVTLPSWPGKNSHPLCKTRVLLKLIIPRQIEKKYRKTVKFSRNELMKTPAIENIAPKKICFRVEHHYF